VTSFTFTTEELRSAPAEVRRWLLGRIDSDLSALMVAPTSPRNSPALAACTPEEAARIFDLIRDDFAATHVFLELARDLPSGDNSGEPLHAVNIGALLRNTRLSDHALVSCLQTIDRAFQEIRHDAEAVLFGFDQANHLFVHETTYRSVRSLWQGLLRPHAPADAAPAAPLDWPAADFQPRELGPSEDVLTHRPGNRRQTDTHFPA